MHWVHTSRVRILSSVTLTIALIGDTGCSDAVTATLPDRMGKRMIPTTQSAVLERTIESAREKDALLVAQALNSAKKGDSALLNILNSDAGRLIKQNGNAVGIAIGSLQSATTADSASIPWDNVPGPTFPTARVTSTFATAGFNVSNVTANFANTIHGTHSSITPTFTITGRYAYSANLPTLSEMTNEAALCFSGWRV